LREVEREREREREKKKKKRKEKKKERRERWRYSSRGEAVSHLFGFFSSPLFNFFMTQSLIRLEQHRHQRSRSRRLSTRRETKSEKEIFTAELPVRFGTSPLVFSRH